MQRLLILLLLIILFFALQISYSQDTINSNNNIIDTLFKKLSPSDTLALRNFQTQLENLNKIVKNYAFPDCKYFIFGIGERPKYLYKEGLLIKLFTGDTIKKWSVIKEYYIPNKYKVILFTNFGKKIEIFEAPRGIMLNQSGFIMPIQGTEIPVNVPDFKLYPYSEIMKALYYDIIINIFESKPFTNFLTYNTPSIDDAAVIAITLKRNGNIDLIKKWYEGLHKSLNVNYLKASELGQLLFLSTLFDNKNNRLNDMVLNAIPRFEINDTLGKYINDSTNMPVYSTKWLKYGLKELQIVNNYNVPAFDDKYAYLMWHDHKKVYFIDTSFVNSINESLPYSGWAYKNYNKNFMPYISDQYYPLTYRINKININTPFIKYLPDACKNKNIIAPDSRHAAEILLYLMNNK